ncbi:MAG: hypothetical protein GEV11_00070 [Streptosporangiales bacterium]|nr:hypothetical protein [Streptosporangiales bacterium]
MRSSGIPLRAADRSALGLWLATRVSVVLIGVVGAWYATPAGQAHPLGLGRWFHWDAALLAEIAEFGYNGNPREPADPGLPAFFPGFPLLLRAVAVPLGGDYVLGGLLISLVAGGVAAVALARLGELEGARVGPYAVAALLFSPMAVFLFAGYSEALFLAFALPAWLLARRGRWGYAALAAAGASCVRITGLFLALALIVEFLMAWRARQPGAEPRALLVLAVPFVPLLAYSIYQFGRTGDLLAWNTAQQLGWGRHLVWPWESAATTWEAAFETGDQFAGAFRTELIAGAVGVVLTLWLAISGRWSEFVYVGLQVGALVTSSYYLSIPRSTVLWFPLWLLVGRMAARHRWGAIWYFALSIPLMAIFALGFTRGQWTG